MMQSPPFPQADLQDGAHDGRAAREVSSGLARRHCAGPLPTTVLGVRFGMRARCSKRDRTIIGHPLEQRNNLTRSAPNSSPRCIAPHGSQNATSASRCYECIVMSATKGTAITFYLAHGRLGGCNIDTYVDAVMRRLLEFPETP